MDCIWFDGEQLNILQNGAVSQSYKAWSGRPGTNKSPASQGVKDKGPLPEGIYCVDSGDITYRSSLSWVRRTFKYTKGAWGDCWVPLKPCPGTNTLGRNGFYIHGGTSPGSAGCIDLLSSDSAFCTLLVAETKPICVIVRYMNETKIKAGFHENFDNCPQNPGLECLQNSNCPERFNDANLQAERTAMLAQILNDCEECCCK